MTYTKLSPSTPTLKFKELAKPKPAIDQVIPFDSPEAASYKTDIHLKGWISAEGRFYGDGDEGERRARYDGCTHKRCACGNLMEKWWSACLTCRQVGDRERYIHLSETFNWSYPLAIYEDDKYFFSEDDLVDYCMENGKNTEDLNLVDCDPNRITEISLDDQGDDLFGEDQEDFPKSVHELLDEKLEKLNAAIRACPPISWSASRRRVTVRIPIDHDQTDDDDL